MVDDLVSFKLVNSGEGQVNDDFRSGWILVLIISVEDIEGGVGKRSIILLELVLLGKMMYDVSKRLLGLDITEFLDKYV